MLVEDDQIPDYSCIVQANRETAETAQTAEYKAKKGVLYGAYAQIQQEPYGLVQFFVALKNLLVFIYSKLHSKSFYYLYTLN